MFKKIKIIRQIKGLRKKPIDKEFLNMLKSRLEAYIDVNPVDEICDKKWTFADLITLKPIKVSLVVISLFILIGAGLAAASQFSLPGDKLFAVKAFTEDARAAFTFNSKSQAELQAKYAAKRVSEINEILEQKGVQAPGLDVALSRLEDNSKKAEALIRKETGSSGSEIELKQKTLENLKGDTLSIRSTLDAKKNELDKQAQDLTAKIQQAQGTANPLSLAALQSQARAIKKLQDQFESEKIKINSALLQSQQRMKLKLNIESNNRNQDQQGQVKGEKTSPNNSSGQEQVSPGQKNKKSD